MSLDFNDAEPQRSSDPIPDGTFAKVAMTIRKGGIDGDEELDRGLLKASQSSDAVNAKSWNDVVKRGLLDSKPIYYAQVQIYMAYLEVPMTLFSALNKDTQELFHEVVPLDAARAQALSDKAVAIIQAAEAQELPPRIAADASFYLCQFCPFIKRCWECPA